jgi:hypothetical protein
VLLVVIEPGLAAVGFKVLPFTNPSLNITVCAMTANGAMNNRAIKLECFIRLWFGCFGWRLK